MKLSRSSTILRWISANGRLYYSLFYLVTAATFGMLSLAFAFSQVASIVNIWPGPTFWVVAYAVIAAMSGFLAFEVHKEPSRRSRLTRVRAIMIGTISGASLARGIIIALLYANLAGFILQLWIAFIIVWAAPLLFYLPTEVDEYVTLRDRVDDLDSKLGKILDGNE